MATFKYRAVSRGGAPVNGVIDAYDEFEAVDRIKESCTVVTYIQEVQAGTSLLQKEIYTPKIKHKTLALLCSQFSIILAAGLPVVRAVKLIEGQTEDRTVKKLLGSVAEDVAAGYGLAQSFENKGSKLLPTTFIETVRAGEESGTLERSFQKLFQYYDKSHKIKSKVRSAMMYPAFLCVLAVAVVAVIMTVTMPTFTSMFMSMDIEMPFLTLCIINLSSFFSSNWLLVLAIIAILLLALKIWSGTEDGRLRLARLQLHLPALGKVARMKGASQLANTLSTLLTAGLPMIRCVAVTAKVLDNYQLSLRLGSIVPSLEEGRRLGECLRECQCFPDMLIEMTSMGEESGSLEETLDTIGAYYDSEVDVATTRALSMLEPAITVVMGIVIGIIVISLYLPMFSMYSGMA